NMCETLADDGQVEAAEEARADCAAALADVGTPAARYMIAMIGVPIRLLRGEIGAALEETRVAIAAADEIGEDGDRREGRVMRADILAHIGANDEALRLTDEVEALAAS